MWQLEDILRATGGTAARIEREAFPAISTDSRTVGEGELFIPLSGPNYDGHLFIGDAQRRSRGGYLCEKTRPEIYRSVPGTAIVVNDALKALLDLARYKRVRSPGTFIGITGSNGKTTTKEIFVAMAGRFASLAYNEKNLNNLIGVSKSVLAIEGGPRFCVFELGTNSKGEIATLAGLVKPDVSLITNVNPSHLQGLASLEGVLEEKLDLYRYTKTGGTVLVNADDPRIPGAYRDRGHVVRTFGMVNSADIRLSVEENLGWDGYAVAVSFPEGTVRARTGLLGRHNLYNVLSAAAIAHAIGMDVTRIEEAIESFQPYTMRFTPVKTAAGYTVVNDTYNANPASMEWAIRTLEDLPCEGRRIVVMGDMRELGEKTSYYHQQLGKFLNGTDISMVLLLGEYVRDTHRELDHGRARLFGDKEELIRYLRQQLQAGDTVLVKGSRMAKMEEVVEAIL
jgi:UDP-N-acetylmuramoyl-tripeptide--D-alanyl-D-alanine ligase